MNDCNLYVFSLLTDLSDDLVEESIIPPSNRIGKSRRAREWFSEMMNSPLAAAVLSGIVALAVLAAIVAAGRNVPSSTVGSTGDQLFYVGMPYEDMLEELDSYLVRDPFQYGNWTFVSFLGGDRCLLITCGANSEGDYVIADIRSFTEKVPTHIDFAEIKVGMDLYEVSSLVGRPEGSYTSGASTLAYRTAEGDLYYVYLHGEGGTVSDVTWINPDPLSASVSFPHSDNEPDLFYSDPARVGLLHDYFAHVYTTLLYDELPSERDPFTCTVSITYENGETKTYMVRGNLLSRDGGGTWAKIQEYQPHVSTTLEELIASIREQ